VRHAALPWLAALAAAALPLPAQQAALAAAVAAADRDPAERGAALAALQDAGQLEVATAVTALGAGGELAAMAAAIVRHEWPVVPAALLDGIAADHDALRALLGELAPAPRPSLADWARRQSGRDELPIGLRCLAVAATGDRPGRAAAALLVAAAAQEVTDLEQGTAAAAGFRTAIWLLEPGVADNLLGRLHAELLGGADPARFQPFFDRLSEQGRERLLGLVVTLPKAQQMAFARYFVARDAPCYRARVAAALDGEIPLEPIWLLGAEGLLDRPARRERLLAVLDDAAADAGLRELAFANLVDASVFTAPVLTYAGAGPSRLRRIRAVLDAGVATLDVAVLRGWLLEFGPLAQATAAALARRPVLEPELEQALVAAAAGTVFDGTALAAATTLLQRGSPAAVAAIWPGLVASPSCDEFVAALARRRVGWGRELLLAELDQPRDEGEQQRRRRVDNVRMALAALGDQAQLRALLAAAADFTTTFARRCRHHIGALDAAAGGALLATALDLADEDLAAELIAWAALGGDAAIVPQLAAIWLRPGFSELHLAALHGLAQGPARAGLVADLRGQLRHGELDERHDASSHELVATMPDALQRDDVELLAELVLTAPLADPAAERARGQRWSQRHGFPLVQAVASRLRGADAALVREVFTAAVARAVAHPDVGCLARTRLLVLWRHVLPDRAILQAVGEATAALLDHLPAAATAEFPGRLFALAAAERRQDEAAAAAAAARALAALRSPQSQQDVRLFLGERDPATGVDPLAALAARPHLGAARAGDRARLAVARELAGRDAATLHAIDLLERPAKD
jgi:hypothetical protein